MFEQSQVRHPDPAMCVVSLVAASVGSLLVSELILKRANLYGCELVRFDYAQKNK